VPELIYTGLTDWYYPATRDARGILLSEVKPGDIRDLDEAPDRQWRPVTGEDRAAAPEAEDAAAATEPAAPASPVPAGPVPAPPAVMPATAPTPAGVTGRQE
jgi:hypothetical protein